MSTTPEEPVKLTVLHDPNSRSTQSNSTILPPTTHNVVAPHLPNAPMIHPRLPVAPHSNSNNDHLTTTWSRDEEGRPVTLHHSWHPNHPAPRQQSQSQGYGYMHRDSRSMRSSPDFFQYRRPPSRQHTNYMHYEEHDRRIMMSRYNQQPNSYYEAIPKETESAPRAYYEAKRLEDEAIRKEIDSKTGLVLPPHNSIENPYSGPVRTVPPVNNGNGCSCKKSKCLKLYCACFSNSILCRADCKCDGCQNSSDESQKEENAIQVARRAVLGRNPKAFHGKIGGEPCAIELNVVRPMFSRALPLKMMPENDFRSLERLRTNSVSPREADAASTAAAPVIGGITAEKAKIEPFNEASTANKVIPTEAENAVRNSIYDSEDAKVSDNATEKSDGVSTMNMSKSPDQSQAELASISTFNSNPRPDAFNRNPSPHDAYYRPSPTYQQHAPYAWDNRHYSREIGMRRQSFSSYQHLPTQVRAPAIIDPRSQREIPSIHPYRSFEQQPSFLPMEAQQKQHRVGCKCKKSMCLKKYCECFQYSIQCGMTCKCVNCGNKPDVSKTTDSALGKTTEVVNTMLSLDQTVSLESEETPNLHVVSEDTEAVGYGRPPSLPSLASITFQTNEEIKDKPCEKNLDFLAALATSALDDLQREKRKAEEMELSKIDSEVENKRRFIDRGLNCYYDRQHHQNYRCISSAEHTLKSITTQFQNNTAPWKPNNPTSLNDTKSSKLPKGLTFRKVCSNCGRQRAEHGEFGFGNKCLLTSCGRCGADAQCHQRHRVPMGVMCTLTESDGAVAGCPAKYETILADLAARAKIRVEMGRCE